MAFYFHATTTRLLGLLACVVLHFFLLITPAVADSENTSYNVPSREDITRFINTVTVIKNDYAKPVNDKTLLEDAIRGMVSNLDPHSEYLDEAAYKSLLMSTSGEFGGLGIEIISEFGVLKVVSAMNDTPAAKAGIKSGDYIVAVNGRFVKEMTPEQALGNIRGQKGTPITLTIIRKGQEKPLQFKLTRDTIHIENVKSKLLENGFGYVSINQFQSLTTNLLIDAITKLKKASGGKLKGLILDLRNNPGGLLNAAVDVADVFLESSELNKYKKRIVYTEGRSADAQHEALASGHDLLNGTPLIVLINEGSASASEIVAGALQDYHRALIVGTTSFGKGSVQTVLPLDKTHAIKLTTALYLTPAGRIIQNRGIVPDVTIPVITVTTPEDDATVDEFKEKNLKNRLDGETNNTSKKTDTTDSDNLAKKDFQLYESFNILKAMSQQLTRLGSR